MYRVIVLYEQEPDADAYAEHVELCKQVPELGLPPRQGDRRADGRCRARVLRRVGVRRRGRVQDRDAERRVHGDGQGRVQARLPAADASSSSSFELEPRRAVLADRGDALGDVRPRHVEELERERRVEGRAGGAQPVVQRELRVSRSPLANRTRAGGRSRAPSPRARRRARRATRGRCARRPRRRSARTTTGGTSPSPARTEAARR